MDQADINLNIALYLMSLGERRSRILAFMNERLRAVMERAEKLPDTDQEALAQLLEEELEEREWDALTHKSGARAFHDLLRAELREAEEHGKLQEIDGDKFA